MTDRRTGVLQVGWASSAPVVQAVLGRRPGVLDVAANPVAQTATVVYDGDRTSIAELRGWIESPATSERHGRVVFGGLPRPHRNAGSGPLATIRFASCCS